MSLYSEVAAFHDAWGSIDTEDVDQLGLWEDLGLILKRHETEQVES